MQSNSTHSTVCPQCGHAKYKKSRTCLDCFKRKGRGPVVHNPDGTTLIPLPHGGYTVIDTSDYDRVKCYKWHLTSAGYVIAHTTDIGRGAQSLLHRMVANAKTGEYVDHLDHDIMNNRRSNLALGTQSDNMHNRKKRSDGRYRGVRFRKDTGKFQAMIGKDRIQYALGCFDTAEDAARAYNRKAISLYGDRAILNDILDSRG